MARKCVAPLKQLSMPRLELQAAVLAVRLNCLIKQELTVNIEDTVFWSDSKTVLQYIANESRQFHTFVANRVSKIHDASSLAQWRHVPGHLNPADDCTRGLRVAVCRVEPSLPMACWPYFPVPIGGPLAPRHVCWTLVQK